MGVLKFMKGNFKYLTMIILISIAIFWGGYFIFFCWHGYPVTENKIVLRLTLNKDKNNKQLLATIREEDKRLIERLLERLNNQEKTLQNFTNTQYLTVSNLNAFYSSLFTAIAVIAGIVGLGAWKTIENLKKKLAQLSKIEEKVEFLHNKKDYADWVKSLFDKNNDLTSSKLVLKHADKKKIDEIKDYIETDITNNSWLEMLLAKKMNDDGKYDEAIKLIDFIEIKDLLNVDIKPYLFHFKAQFLWNKYLKEKNGNKKTLLNKAEEYYKKSLREDKSRDETHGNLAVVQIELAEKHYTTNRDKQKKTLESAIKHLNIVIELGRSTYNTYYDLARATYLLNENKFTENIKNFLFKAAEYIESKKAREVFFSYLDEKENIFSIAPDWINIKKEIKNEVDQKKWLK